MSLTPNSDRPYVFCKLETNQGLVGWGEGTLEGKVQKISDSIGVYQAELTLPDTSTVALAENSRLLLTKLEVDRRRVRSRRMAW